ncbi:peptidylprolyl isomerase [Bacteroidetes bacterium endosymbiont of Geopemphigus sp.]|uniref:peptidylprolyl isomerase n=1 Tax=Bacteroidetes bacterium endosymbiont of Geopemphigus sp. TaxID=2047937 RepID=UPI000CD0684D|nr:peptidylprolyl isomerase [Bacteroidetes bacterium endosymbiont of Geopemphigus sp.]
MALLGNIRKHSWLLIIVIGLAMLAFLIDPKTLSILRKDPNIIGKINGEEITRQEYLQQIEFYKQFSQSAPENYLTFQTWNAMLSEKLLNQQAQKIGLQVNDKDFWEAIKRQSIYSGLQQFQDERGAFSRKKFKDYLSKIEENVKTDPQAEKEYKLWLYQKENIPRQLMATQYMEMVFTALNTTKSQTKALHEAKNLSTKINYLFIPYQKYEAKYPVSVKDEEIQKYIQLHKVLYKKPTSRDLSLVVFPGNPSKEDIEKTQKQIQDLVKELKSTNDNEGFISANSEVPYNSEYYSEEYVPDFLKNFVKSTQTGEIYGPIKESNSYIIIKLVDKKMLSASTKASHILITYKGASRSKAIRSKEEAQKLAENLLAAIKSDPKKFETFLEKSDDPSANKNKGDLGWSKRNERNFVPDFQNYIVEQPKGNIGIVETPFGYHIVKIDDKSPPEPAYQLAILAKSLRPSKETENALYAQASKFIQDISKVDTNTFVNKARKSGYQTVVSKGVLASQPSIEELKTDSDPEVIRWAFEKGRKKGDTKMFTTSSGDYIIASISGIQQEGLAALENVKEEIIPILKKKKLAAILSEKIKKINATTLQGLSNTLEEKITENIHVQLSNPQLEGIGPEPKVVGTAMGIALHKISLPIVGNKGVFVLYALQRISQTLKTDNYSKKTYGRENADLALIFQTLKNKSKIKDYRH